MAKTIIFKLDGKKFRVKDCRGLSSLRGLMFDKKSAGALIRGKSIWTPFCSKLDLYFLDDKMKILSRQKAVPLTLNPKTWKIYSDSRAKYCLEIKTR